MTKTREQEEFDCYCLDRIKLVSNESPFPVAYSDGVIIKKLIYKVGLKATIKKQECFILYTESDEDLECFAFIPVDRFFDNQKRFYTEVFEQSELNEIIRKLSAINIFQFTSLLEFNTIYEEFKELLEENWQQLQMDNLIEI